MNEKLEVGDLVRTPQGNEGEVVEVRSQESEVTIVTEHDHGDRCTRGEFPPGLLKKVEATQERPAATKQEQKKRLKEVPLPGAPAPVPPGETTN